MKKKTMFVFSFSKNLPDKIRWNMQRPKLKKNTKIGFVRRNTMKILFIWWLLGRFNDINV